MAVLCDLEPESNAPVTRGRPIQLPPARVLPSGVRPAAARYRRDPGPESRAQLVAAVDRLGSEWEHSIATRAVVLQERIVKTCHLAAALHDELAELQAIGSWLSGFPLWTAWLPQSYRLHATEDPVTIPDLLGAIADACEASERLFRIAGQRRPREIPYDNVPPAPKALSDAGVTLRQVAELMPRRTGTGSVHRWLSGKGTMPPELPGVLEELLGAEEAARILALVPQVT